MEDVADEVVADVDVEVVVVAVAKAVAVVEETKTHLPDHQDRPRKTQRRHHRAKEKHTPAL